MQIGTPKVAGARILEQCDISSPHPVMESVCLLIMSLPDLVALGKEDPLGRQELPKSGKHPVQMIVEKIVHFRLEFLIDEDSKNFDPAQWLETMMKTEFEFELKDMNKLSKAISDFLKSLPRGTLGTSELITNDYADYGLQGDKTHTKMYTCLLLCTDYGLRTDDGLHTDYKLIRIIGLQIILSAQVRRYLNG